MEFPEEKDLKKIREKLERSKGFYMLSPEATERERFRFYLCQEFANYLLVNKITAKELADHLSITKADMSRILNHRINRFSTDKLLNLYSIIHPEYKLKVS